MRRDWVKIYRRSLKSWLFQDAEVWRLWCWCLMRANFRDRDVVVKTGRGTKTVSLKAGQFVYGRLTAAKALGASASCVYRRMNKLQEHGCIVIEKPDAHFSVVTVINWATYQERKATKRTGKKRKSEQATGQANEQATGQATEHRQERLEERLEEDSSSKNSKKTQMSLFGEGDSELARWFYSELQKLSAGIKPPKFDKWANQIRLMREQDGRDHDGIREIIRFALSDSFWQSKCLSPEKVRKHFDSLTIQAKAKTNGHSKPNLRSGMQYDPLAVGDF